MAGVPAFGVAAIGRERVRRGIIKKLVTERALTLVSYINLSVVSRRTSLDKIVGKREQI